MVNPWGVFQIFKKRYKYEAGQHKNKESFVE